MKISIVEKDKDAVYKHLLKAIESKESLYWQRAGEESSLKLFHQMAKRVPAYKDFLKKNDLKPEHIHTAKDLIHVPPVSKDTYLRAYPYDQLVWDGTLAQPLTIHSTSGTTGIPSYFYRDISSDFKRRLVIENFIRQNSMSIEGPTLFIIALGMGVWSAGMGVYSGVYLASKISGYPISIVSPGVNKTEVLKILRTIAPKYHQVIISAYPPLAKDIIDEAVQEGIDLEKMNLRFFFTGEAFGESFRNYIQTNAHVKNVLIDTLNTYGTSELGPTAVETPLSIMIRRLLSESMFTKLFGEIKKTPTLAQYVPTLVNFDCTDNELYFTGDDGIPLMRYQSGDHGGIYSYAELKDLLKKNNIDIEVESKRAGIEAFATQLPFVYVYERKNLVTTLYGALIYPEYLKSTLLDPDLHELLTGKFSMLQRYDPEQNQYIEINIELRKNMIATEQDSKKVRDIIVTSMQLQSSEFAELCKNLGTRVHPKIVFWPYEDPQYFAPGLKQQWVKKS